MEQPAVTTERLILRPYYLTDAEAVCKLAGNINVAKTTLNIPHPYSQDMAQEWISTHQERWLSGQGAIFAVIDNQFQTLVGTVSLVEINGAQAEIGYWFGEPYWNCGFCTEATGALITFSRDNLVISHFTAEHLASNPASGRVLEKVGLTYFDTISKLDRDGKMVNVKKYKTN